MSFVINPDTNRKIKVNGPTYKKLYQRLLSRGLTEAEIQDRLQMPVHVPDLEASKQQVLPPSLRHRAETYKDVSQGQATRGWAIDKPKRGKERHQLKAKCGKKCFLIPETEGFPICSKDKCEIDRRALIAAKIRAKQHGYLELLPAIDQLLKGFQ